MRIGTFLGAAATTALVGLALVALSGEHERGSDLPVTTARAADAATIATGTPPTAPRHSTVLSIPSETQNQQPSPDELEGSASSAPLAGDDEDYHGTVEIETELIVPCDGGARPADLEDPQCVARWSVFHVAAGLVDSLDPAWIEPTLLDELSTNRSGTGGELPRELLVLDSIGRVNQVGPGRAKMEVIVERVWSSGQLDHLLYQVSLVRSYQGTWSIVAIGRS